MRAIHLAAAIAVLAAAAAPLAAANLATGNGEAITAPKPAQGRYLQCVPYARRVSGIAIYGDAHTWWSQAQGKFARGSEPKVGAVMNFRPHGNSRLGHVAAVSRIIDDRTIIIRHANWSARGKIDTGVRVIDVSPDNDWSAVRVWNTKAQTMGGGTWPLYGFIYNEKPGRKTKPEKARKAGAEARLAAISDGVAPVGLVAKQTGAERKRVAKAVLARPMAGDPIGAIIARGR